MRIPVALLHSRHPDAADQQAIDRQATRARTRSVVMARNGAIATSQPLATAAGLRVLQSGGNAIDAAVTAAAVLSVVEPTMNGAGGDLFAIVYSAKDKKVHGLNASGRAPAAATLEEFKKRGLQRIPLRGELSVSVPGRRGRLARAALEARHANAGAGARAGHQVRARRLRRQRDHRGPVEERRERCWRRDPKAAATFLINGKAPAPGRRRPEPGARGVARADREGRSRRVLQGSDREGDRRRHAAAARACSRRRTSPTIVPTGSSRCRRPIAATRCSSCRPTRRASLRSRCSTSSKAST